MTERLKRSESVREGWHRAGMAALDAMRRDLAPGSGPEGIHDARKRCKWLRALLRLIRAGLPEDARRAESRRLRDLARSLAGARDAEVRLLTFKDVAARSRHRTTRAFKAVQARLEAGAVEAGRAMDSSDVLAVAQKTLDGAIAGWEALPVHRHGWHLLSPGLRAGYAHARRAFRETAADPSPSDEALHDWRRYVKTLGYQISFLRNLRPRKMEGISEGLDELGDLLGRDHDLAVLWNDVSGSVAGLDPLDAMIRRRRAHLQQCAFRLGKQLFEGKPRRFIQRLEGWWHEWR